MAVAPISVDRQDQRFSRYPDPGAGGRLGATSSPGPAPDALAEKHYRQLLRRVRPTFGFAYSLNSKTTTWCRLRVAWARGRHWGVVAQFSVLLCVRSPQTPGRPERALVSEGWRSRILHSAFRLTVRWHWHESALHGGNQATRPDSELNYSFNTSTPDLANVGAGGRLPGDTGQRHYV